MHVKTGNLVFCEVECHSSFSDTSPLSRYTVASRAELTTKKVSQILLSSDHFFDRKVTSPIWMQITQ